MKAPTLHILAPEQLGPYVEGLRNLEREILYPIDDGADTFAIDHGPDYHRFFSEMGHRARFMVVTDEAGQVVGSLAGAWRRAELDEAPINTAYLGDLKLAPEVRGTGLVARMLWRALAGVTSRPDLRGWSLAWGAAMRGERGDVTRSLRGANPGRIAGTLGVTRLYFVSPQQLADLDTSASPPPPPGPGLDLSPELRAADVGPVLSTRGRKDFRLTSTGLPWPLLHIACGPRQWQAGFGRSLVEGARAARALEQEAVCCFGLDVRMREHIAWLSARGVEPGATCTVYGFAFNPRLNARLSRTRWLHLATCHI